MDLTVFEIKLSKHFFVSCYRCQPKLIELPFAGSLIEMQATLFFMISVLKIQILSLCRHLLPSYFFISSN